MNALPEYVRPVPAVVVALLVTTPPNTANPPLDNDGSCRVPTDASVDDEVVNDPYVVDEKLNLFTPEKKLVSDSSVDEAVLSVDVIVIGAEPRATNEVHDVEPEHDTVVVAVVLTSPVEPTYVRPCDRDESLRLDANVDDAVDRRPETPSTDVVELPHDCDVNGNTCAASVDVPIVCTSPFDPRYEKPCPRDDRYTLDENVDDAVENSPFSRPSVVVVEL